MRPTFPDTHPGITFTSTAEGDTNPPREQPKKKKKQIAAPRSFTHLLLLPDGREIAEKARFSQSNKTTLTGEAMTATLSDLFLDVPTQRPPEQKIEPASSPAHHLHGALHSLKLDTTRMPTAESVEKAFRSLEKARKKQKDSPNTEHRAQVVLARRKIYLGLPHLEKPTELKNLQYAVEKFGELPVRTYLPAVNKRAIDAVFNLKLNPGKRPLPREVESAVGKAWNTLGDWQALQARFDLFTSSSMKLEPPSDLRFAILAKRLWKGNEEKAPVSSWVYMLPTMNHVFAAHTLRLDLRERPMHGPFHRAFHQRMSEVRDKKPEMVEVLEAKELLLNEPGLIPPAPHLSPLLDIVEPKVIEVPYKTRLALQRFAIHPNRLPSSEELEALYKTRLKKLGRLATQVNATEDDKANFRDLQEDIARLRNFIKPGTTSLHVPS